MRAPSTVRTAMKTWVEGASRNPMLATAKAASATRIKGRRPKRSASVPINGAAMNWASAKDIVISPNASTPEPSSPSRLAKTGIIMPKPVIISATQAASSRMMVRT